jgi:hypothetical protein
MTKPQSWNRGKDDAASLVLSLVAHLKRRRKRLSFVLRRRSADRRYGPYTIHVVLSQDTLLYVTGRRSEHGCVVSTVLGRHSIAEI